MRYRWASATHKGRVRAKNEDAVHPQSGGSGGPPLVVAVADGMGGHVAGEVASRLALDAAVAEEAGPQSRVEVANRAVVEASRRKPDLRGMGTTLTLGRIDEEDRLVIGHVGDSRAYLLRDRVLAKLTTDHSVNRYVLTQALGMEDPLDVEIVEEELRPGDRLLFCSDGLTSMVPDDRIAEILDAHPDPEEAASALVEAANAAGGEDNISVILVDTLT